MLILTFDEVVVEVEVELGNTVNVTFFDILNCFLLIKMSLQEPANKGELSPKEYESTIRRCHGTVL